jgi:adenine-specific DNA methylase
MFLGNWLNLANIYPQKISAIKQALAFSAFFQCALKKRPFNLFHRANLYIRTSRVKRTFGNKTSWDGPFESYFKSFSKELNNAVFHNSKKNTASNKVAKSLRNGKNYGLVYIDPPYIRKGVSPTEVDYMRFYHFLEGATDPLHWKDRIDYNSKTLHLAQTSHNDWIYSASNRDAFEKMFDVFSDSIIVISYKEPGIPTKRQLIYSLKKYKKNVISVPGIAYDYALNKNNGYHKEYFLIGVDR